MKTITKSTSAGRRLGLLTATITLLGGLAVSAQPGLIINETFDPPTLIPPSGFESPTGVADLSREYVSDGFAGSTALKTSATITEAGGYFATLLYQNGVVQGNDLATRESTVLSFNLKVDQPGLTHIYISLQSWSGYGWSGSPGQSYAFIPLASYTPGKFQTLVVPLDDPLWLAAVSDDDPPVPTPFEPGGKTYQISVAVGGWLMTVPGPISITLDNIRISTKDFMLPWKLTSAGQMTVNWGTGAATVSEAGSSTLLGDYTSVIHLENLFGDVVTGPAELTADNGDKLFGQAYGLSWEPVEVLVVIGNGTGRFQGAIGSYMSTFTWTEFLASFTATANGSISRIGCSQ